MEYVVEEPHQEENETKEIGVLHWKAMTRNIVEVFGKFRQRLVNNLHNIWNGKK